MVQAGAGRIAADEHDDVERFARIRRSGEEALADMSRLVDLVQPGTSVGAVGARRLEALLANAEAAGLKLCSEGVADSLWRPRSSSSRTA